MQNFLATLLILLLVGAAYIWHLRRVLNTKSQRLAGELIAHSGVPNIKSQRLAEELIAHSLEMLHCLTEDKLFTSMYARDIMTAMELYLDGDGLAAGSSLASAEQVYQNVGKRTTINREVTKKLLTERPGEFNS